MPSKRPVSWLARVERILTARTHDLRQLAKLADLDPETMYVGTRLDGADLRGQDLRGMRLTHLDRDAIQIDDQTRLDIDETAKTSILPHVALVHFNDRDLEEGYRRQPSRMPADIEVFGPDQADAFWSACKRHSGPKLVLGLASAGAPSRRYASDGPESDVVFVLGVGARIGQFRDGVREAVQAEAAPLVLVPLPLDFGARGDKALSAAFCDFVALAQTEWGFVTETMRSEHFVLFFSASPESRDDPDGAWFQLAARLWKLGVFGGGGYRIGSQRDARGAHLSTLLLPDLKPQSVREFRHWPGARAMVLLEPTISRKALKDDHYADIIASVLEGNGWREVGIQGRQVSDIPPIGLAGFEFEGDHFALHLDVSFQSPVSFSTMPATALPITVAEGLCVSEVADATTILSMLHEYRRLLVSLQDLRWLDASATSLWPLVAHQARRIARGSQSQARTNYFIALMRNAVELNRNNPNPAALAEKLAEKNFGYNEQLRIVTVAFERGRVVFRISIRSPGSYVGGLESFLLGIDASGPFIAGSNREAIVHP